jgi:hypothetical protein
LAGLLVFEDQHNSALCQLLAVAVTKDQQHYVSKRTVFASLHVLVPPAYIFGCEDKLVQSVGPVHNLHTFVQALRLDNIYNSPSV